MTIDYKMEFGGISNFDLINRKLKKSWAHKYIDIYDEGESNSSKSHLISFPRNHLTYVKGNFETEFQKATELMDELSNILSSIGIKYSIEIVNKVTGEEHGISDP